MKVVVPAKYHHHIIPTYRAFHVIPPMQSHQYIPRVQLLDASKLFVTTVITITGNQLNFLFLREAEHNKYLS